jgi:hypothetical protein
MDTIRLPVFVLRVTFLMPMLRIAGFATMLHQSWRTRGKWAGEGAPVVDRVTAFELAPANEGSGG